MKKQLLIFIILFISSSFCYAQAWQWSNPKPTNNDLRSTFFVTANTGFIAGKAGLIMKTTDGGINWQIKNTGTSIDIVSIFFTSTTIGYAIGFDLVQNTAVVIKTNNGGETWSSQNPEAGLKVNKIYFINPDTGFIVGDNGLIMKTINSGEDWEIMINPSLANFKTICFIDSNTGWVGGYDDYYDGIIMKTTDGGNTWDVVSSGTYFVIESICFTDQSTGYATDQDNVIKSTDGGLSWTTVLTPGWMLGFFSIDCLNADTVIAVGMNGNIQRTSDGGANWNLTSTVTINDLFEVYMFDSNHGYSVGELGTVLKTTDGGHTWQLMSSGNVNNIVSIRFSDESTGYALSDNGVVLKTNDAGTMWNSISAGNDYHSNLLAVSGKNTLHFHAYKMTSMGVDSNFIFRSTDAGESWTSTYEGFYSPVYSIFFYDSVVGYALVGETSSGTMKLLKTMDAGASWLPWQSFWKPYYSVFFSDPLTGYLVGDDEILRTTDGAQTWTSTAISGVIYSLWFINNDIGFAVGYESNISGIILKTTDGGETWSTYSTNTPYPIEEMMFADNQTGYAAGGYGLVFKTTDCGETWNLLNTYSSNTLQSVCATDLNTVYVAGTNGTILKTTSGGIVDASNYPVSNFAKIYPNPVNDLFTLQLPENFINAKYTVYNINGQNLLTGIVTGTTTQINISNIPGGIYFIRITDRDNVDVVKMMKN